MIIWSETLSCVNRVRPQLLAHVEHYALVYASQRRYTTASPTHSGLPKPHQKGGSIPFVLDAKEHFVIQKGSTAKTIKALSKLKKRLALQLKAKKAGKLNLIPAPPKSGTNPFIKENEWRGENWKNDWGEDKLRPGYQGEKKNKKQAHPAHLHTSSRYPIKYTRRIEGLIEPLGRPVLEDLPPVFEQRPISTLAHGLDRVLFNPGVHWLHDPRSRVYNFTPWVENIPKVTDFAFERLRGFVKSSRDEELWALAKREGKTFAGSTSSLTGMLDHIYFLISGDKPVDTQVLSRSFWSEPTGFTPGQRMPSSVLFNHSDGVYAIDSASDKAGHAEKNILTWMGTLLEKFLTMSSEEFTSYTRTSPEPDNATDPTKEAFRYAKSDRFIMRSQLDCHDKRLPGTGVFDIKTRACLPIRLDILNFEEHSGYLIKTQHGIVESFEKEYYDLIRSAFLKYSFQARIGNMDGVFVAYHNTAKMFGFQYIPLEEMDERLFGPGRTIGEKVFEKCVRLLEIISQEIIQCFPGQSIRCTFEAKENDRKLNIWVEPTEWNGDREWPVKQLEVQITNYIGVSQVTGSRAISACDAEEAKWSVHWSVCRLAHGEGESRATLQAAKERQFRAYNFPSGVDASEMPEFWAGLNFGGKAQSESGPVYKLENFRAANRSIERLREMSRAGREELDRIAAQEAGKPKIVYGQSEPWTAITGDDNDAEETCRECEETRTGDGTDVGLDTQLLPAVRGHDFSDDASLLDEAGLDGDAEG
ncbi:hypothetical protein AX17_005023 [Amanita inopinata Kibby_2008]|nr:hypothetical protein AX17_005023 [Amanita inopinata Kibby_2008]